MDKEKNTFEKALVEAVDEGLLMLGESGREVIYFRLKHSYALGKEDIPSHPEIFVGCLRKIFGSGARVIEKAVIKSLYRRLGLKFAEKEGFDFFEYLREAKKQASKDL
jgi:hypothetical protein